MEYKVESSLEQFEAWSGGRVTLDVIKEKGDCDDVERILVDYFGCSEDVPTDTAINDILWFERDWIAEELGYRDWEAYEEGWSERDLNEIDSVCGRITCAHDWHVAMALKTVYGRRAKEILTRTAWTSGVRFPARPQ